jgi:hypothetical protein
LKSYSQSSFTVTEAASAASSFTFNGTGVQIFGAKRANHGNYQVKVIIYCIRPLVGILQQPLFFITTLKQGLRRVTLTNQEKAFVNINFVRLSGAESHGY